MFLVALLASFSLQSGSPSNMWTWALYENDGPLVLANEVPDTPELRSTLQCQAGSGLARVSLYGTPMPSGFAQVTAGEASATTAADGSRNTTVLTLRTDHPVFTQFVASGALNIALGDQSRSIAVDRNHRAKLRRFAGLCGG